MKHLTFACSLLLLAATAAAQSPLANLIQNGERAAALEALRAPGTDVNAAQRAGLRGVFVLSGKHKREDLAAAVSRGRRAPDLVAGSLADVVAALD